LRFSTIIVPASGDDDVYNWQQPVDVEPDESDEDDMTSIRMDAAASVSGSSVAGTMISNQNAYSIDTNQCAREPIVIDDCGVDLPADNGHHQNDDSFSSEATDTDCGGDDSDEEDGMMTRNDGGHDQNLAPLSSSESLPCCAMYTTCPDVPGNDTGHLATMMAVPRSLTTDLLHTQQPILDTAGRIVGTVTSGSSTASFPPFVYTAPVMAADWCRRQTRILPSTATSLCGTLTVSSPSFSLPICAAVVRSMPAASSTPSAMVYDSGTSSSINVGLASVLPWLSNGTVMNINATSPKLVSGMAVSRASVGGADVPYTILKSLGLGSVENFGEKWRSGMFAEINRVLCDRSSSAAVPSNGIATTQSSNLLSTACLSPCQFGTRIADVPLYGAALTPQNLSNQPVSNNNDIVCSIATPVMADVLLRQQTCGADIATAVPPAVHCSMPGGVYIPATAFGLPLFGAAAAMGAVLSPDGSTQTDLPVATRQLATAVSGSDVAIPMIALFNVGTSGFASLSSFSCAAALIPQAATLQFVGGVVPNVGIESALRL
jgi:hypothetical protein